MVQKKAPDKHGTPAEPKRNHAKPEKRLYSQQNHHHQQQDSRGSGASSCGSGGGGGGGELKKMLKKSRSIKVLEESLDSPLDAQLVQLGKPAPQKKKRRLPFSAGLPNYMKSTRSSNAKKEQAQVSSSHHSKKKAPCHGGASGSKPAKLLARALSLRAMRPPMKKILGIPLSPKINASRATCSSTMKETTFPDYLDLSPGATEAEGTSAFKVCPYTYCSLNGHRHAPLPPLRCFLSARRRLLKTQKSIKLRGLPSFRKTGPAKEEEEEIAGAEQGVSSLVEDLGDDFFVEIYTKCGTDASAPVGGDGCDAHPVAADAMAYGDREEEDCEAEIEDDGESPIDDSRSQTTLDENFDQISEFSPSEMEVLIDFLEYVECDSEDPSCPADDQGDHGIWDCCIPTDCSGFGGGFDEEEGGCEPSYAAAAANLDGGGDDGLYIDFDEIEYSEFAEDESCDGVSFQFDADGTAYNEDRLGTIFTLPEEEREEDTEEIDAENEEAIEASASLEDLRTKIEDMLGKQVAEAVAQETEEDLGALSSTQPINDPRFGEEKNRTDAHAEVSELCEDTPADEIDDLTVGIELLFCDVDPHTVDNEENQETTAGKDQNEDSDMEMEACGSENGHESLLSQALEEIPAENDETSGAHPELLTTATSSECPEDDATVSAVSTRSSVAEEEDTDISDDSRARGMVITRRNASADEEDELRAFNPRAPNFLPVEPDPEAEKVDLRHQMMDERKNSEEWMLDYALRRAVDKLGPGRKKKVALLVEAFETVAPEPPYGSTLGHSTVGFPHARPIQACS